ncbi:uncharacterized protein LOC6731499 [Drosophila simulans]|uniref:GD23534 n=1 Tax=Drosophila simulans TaxID=7240 RepID=B4Q6S4_DROSI|nr:uncharacterized protein LOC6731499 [Drosophila simulans]EDX04233.1 GD23534 [Drosophila simulans]KMY89066.1 uncharacterized protein Dsimw501_GD23534 [Drosophila simulans]
MPHKRRNRVHANQRNFTTRLVSVAKQVSAPPNVLVESCNGAHAENSSPGSPKAKGGAMTNGKNPTIQLAVPICNTTVRKQNEAHIISNINLQMNFHKESNLIAPQITKKMNFAPNRVVFGVLVPFNVNDSVLVPHNSKPDALKQTSKESESCKAISEPQLADFVEKVDPIIMAVKEPVLNLDWVPGPFDFFGAYKRTYN